MAGGSTNGIVAVKLDEVDLVEGWVELEPRKRGRFDFCLTAAQGCASSSVIYFEVQPGDSVLRHVHSAEEVLLILEGIAAVEIAGERAELGAEGLVLVPPLAPHAIDNVGDSVLRVVGFFSSAAAVHTYEAEIAPFGTNVIVSPPPEELLGLVRA